MERCVARHATGQLFAAACFPGGSRIQNVRFHALHLIWNRPVIERLLERPGVRISFSRPDFLLDFLDIRARWRTVGIDVFACGGEGLVKSLREACIQCREATTVNGEEVRVTLHEESFG